MKKERKEKGEAGEGGKKEGETRVEEKKREIEGENDSHCRSFVSRKPLGVPFFHINFTAQRKEA